jgi:hypothetical protein
MSPKSLMQTSKVSASPGVPIQQTFRLITNHIPTNTIARIPQVSTDTRQATMKDQCVREISTIFIIAGIRQYFTITTRSITQL